MPAMAMIVLYRYRASIINNVSLVQSRWLNLFHPFVMEWPTLSWTVVTAIRRAALVAVTLVRPGMRLRLLSARVYRYAFTLNAYAIYMCVA